MDWVEYFYNIAEEVKKKSKDKLYRWFKHGGRKIS